MSYLTDQVERLEEQYDDAVSALQEARTEIGELQEEVETLRYDVESMQNYIEWFEATYPEARVAYEVAQRIT